MFYHIVMMQLAGAPWEQWCVGGKTIIARQRPGRKTRPV